MFRHYSSLIGLHVRAAWDDALDDERGDVPGWVLITLMTVGIVIAIWAFAGPALEGLIRDAIERVAKL